MIRSRLRLHTLYTLGCCNRAMQQSLTSESVKGTAWSSVEPFVGYCLPACHTGKTAIKHVREGTEATKKGGREGRRKVSEQHKERTTRGRKGAKQAYNKQAKRKTRRDNKETYKQADTRTQKNTSAEQATSTNEETAAWPLRQEERESERTQGEEGGLPSYTPLRRDAPQRMEGTTTCL